MRTYKYGDYTMTLDATGRRDRYGKPQIAYTLSKEAEGDPIFSGDDCYAGLSGRDDPEGMGVAEDLLSFLTLRPGDIEDDYFEDYTERQLEFATHEAEDLQMWVLCLSEANERMR